MIGNTTPATATDVVVTVQPDAGLSGLIERMTPRRGQAVQTTGGAGWTCTIGSAVTCSLPTLAAGATSNLGIDLLVGETADSTLAAAITATGAGFSTATTSVTLAISAGTASTADTTVAPVTELPKTGGDSDQFVITAAMLLLAGAALVAGARRRPLR